MADVESRQVFDLPALRLLVTEHQLISKVCMCGTITKAAAPAGVLAPVQYGSRLAGIGVYLFHGQFLFKNRTVGALGDLFGARIAGNTLVAWTQCRDLRLFVGWFSRVVDLRGGDPGGVFLLDQGRAFRAQGRSRAGSGPVQG